MQQPFHFFAHYPRIFVLGPLATNLFLNLSDQSMQLFDVEGHTNKVPLAFDCFIAAQKETSESHHRLDDPKYRLRCNFSSCVNFSAFFGLQSMLHPGHTIGVIRRWRRFSEALP